MTFIKDMRQKEQLKQAQLAKLIGVSPSYLSLIERGKRRPSVEAAKRIGAVLGFDWTLFFEEEGEE